MILIVSLAGLPVISLRSLPRVFAGLKRISTPISLRASVRSGQSGTAPAIFSIFSK
jgi:hypothetical protein